MRRIREVEKQRQSLIDQRDSHTKLLDEAASDLPPSLSALSPDLAKAHKQGKHPFSSVSRDHYYKVHGLRTEQPKLGNIYKPRYDFVDK